MNAFWIIIILEVHMDGVYFTRVEPGHYATEQQCQEVGADIVDGDGGEQFVCSLVEEMPHLASDDGEVNGK